MNTKRQPIDAGIDLDLIKLMRTARELEIAIARMDTFSATNASGVRAVPMPYYDAVMRAAARIREQMK